VVLALLGLGAAASIRSPYHVALPESSHPIEAVLTIDSAAHHGVKFVTTHDIDPTWIQLPRYFGLSRHDGVIYKNDTSIELPVPDSVVKRDTRLNAIAAGLTVARKAVAVRGEGVQVLVQPASPDSPPVRSVIIRAANKPVHTVADLYGILDTLDPDKLVPLELSNGKRATLYLRAQPFLTRGYRDPLRMRTKGLEVHVTDSTIPAIEPHRTDMHITSAGLAMAIAAYEASCTVDLAQGRKVVATGSIVTDGSVIPVGGVAQKAVVARDEHADIFLVPEANLSEAIQNPAVVFSGVKIVPVANVSNAVRYLAGDADWNHGTGPVGCIRTHLDSEPAS
jgi:PDZ domain-containing secreted protein